MMVVINIRQLPSGYSTSRTGKLDLRCANLDPNKLQPDDQTYVYTSYTHVCIYNIIHTNQETIYCIYINTVCHGVYPSYVVLVFHPEAHQGTNFTRSFGWLFRRRDGRSWNFWILNGLSTSWMGPAVIFIVQKSVITVTKPPSNCSYTRKIPIVNGYQLSYEKSASSWGIIDGWIMGSTDPPKKQKQNLWFGSFSGNLPWFQDPIEGE